MVDIVVSLIVDVLMLSDDETCVAVCLDYLERYMCCDYP